MLELFAIILNNVFQQLKGSNKEVFFTTAFYKIKTTKMNHNL